MAALRKQMPEHFRVLRAAAYKRNRSQDLARSAQYAKNNPEQMREIKRRWAAKNIDYFVARNAKRRARRFQAIPAWANLQVMQGFYRSAKNATRKTRMAHHVDHIVPLNSKVVCGLHCEANFQILEGKENTSKGNRRWPDMP
jgi:hypothetical protein